ncbi:MAG: sulfurtransferase TusA [SAR86 cluster bacterium]|uniref:Sulfurtransferase TusA n=1 Tax=SAR86 cluster bacterium TaxID=2030880 RepID=A0A2A5C808_9GAMM|nr:sulfurtransferase TusA [bacterium AH-315-I11]PCJ39621.1 MAG: sulfurtransferase TusA [SAR86 cluster bacterium]
MTQNSEIKDYTLDARGLFCPEPVMLLHKKIREIKPGDKVIVRATDPSTIRDIPKFCHFLGHELLESKTQDNEFCFVILKAGTSAST